MKITSVALLALCCSSATAFAPVKPLRMPTTSFTAATTLNMASSEEFQNDGLFGWMGMYLDMLGMEEGKVPKFGFLASDPDVDDTTPTNDAEAAASRQNAVDNMTNIGMQERERRDKAGDVAVLVTVAYAIVSSLFLDDGSLFGGHLVRFAIVVPLFLAMGYKKSAETGL